MNLNIEIKKVNPEARIPTYATLGAAGFDFYSAQAGQVTYGGPVVFGTGVAMAIPENYVLLVCSRSGHGFKENVRLSNSVGVIDSDYRGEIMVKLTMDFPSWQNTLNVNIGDRIAQGVLVPVTKVNFVEVNELSQTQRGTSGLGSTGV